MVTPLKSARSTLPGTGKPHECPTCGRRVADKRSLRQHVAAAHPAPADEMRAAIPETGHSVSDNGSNDLRTFTASNTQNRAFR